MIVGEWLEGLIAVTVAFCTVAIFLIGLYLYETRREENESH